MTTPEKRCSAEVWPTGSFQGYPCRKPAKFERDGRHYCGVHDPVSAEERRKKRRAEQGPTQFELALRRARIATRHREALVELKERFGGGCDCEDGAPCDKCLVSFALTYDGKEEPR